MVTVTDVVLEGRTLRAFGTLADNSAHIDMVSISAGLFFLFLFYNTTELLGVVEICYGLRLPLYSMANLNLNCSLEFSSSRSIITFSSLEKVIKKRPAQSSQVE